MNFKSSLTRAAMCALMLAASAAQADELLATNNPNTNINAALTLDSSNWVAEGFTVSAATQINSVAAYLSSVNEAADWGQSFTFAIYANQGNVPALDWNQANQGQLFSVSANYQGAGWNSINNLGWNIGAGSYWFAIEVGSSDGVTGLMANTGATPTAPMAYYAGGQGYRVDAAAGDVFAAHVSAVPEPSGYALLGVGLLGLAALWRRRSSV